MMAKKPQTVETSEGAAQDLTSPGPVGDSANQAGNSPDQDVLGEAGGTQDLASPGPITESTDQAGVNPAQESLSEMGLTAQPRRDPTEDDQELFTVFDPVKHDGVSYAIGDEISLTQTEHRAAYKAGIVNDPWPED